VTLSSRDIELIDKTVRQVTEGLGGRVGEVEQRLASNDTMWKMHLDNFSALSNDQKESFRGVNEKLDKIIPKVAKIDDHERKINALLKKSWKEKGAWGVAMLVWGGIIAFVR